jgi:hypothetical protein
VALLDECLWTVGFERARCDAARRPNLFWRRLGSDERSDTDQRHGEERCEVVDVSVLIDVAGDLSVGEGVVERSAESLEIGLNVLGRSGIELLRT